ncbi:MAG TPA: glycosyltransferase family 2 protein [Luteibaculaceae bacterium]|nr:glycosyltransferase family 2 protein [Luteibaculaceae bacterium]
MSSPVITIITVTFNAQQALEKTILNIDEQAHRSDFEYVIIDGGSADKKIIEANANRIDQWISEPDRGIYDAMNKGLALAKGRYVWFINAGDLLFDDCTVKRVIDVIEDQVDVIYGETMEMTEQGEEIGLRRLKAPDQLDWRSFQDGMLVCHQSIVVKKSITRPYNLNYSISADQDWVISALKQAQVVVNANCILSRFAKGGKSGQNILKSLVERFSIMTKHYGFLPTLLRHIPIAFRFVWYYARNRRF